MAIQESTVLRKKLQIVHTDCITIISPSEIAARNKPPFKYGGSRQQPKDRTGKVVPVAAGAPGSGRQSPKHIVDIRRANKERAREQRPGSKYD